MVAYSLLFPYRRDPLLKLHSVCFFQRYFFLLYYINTEPQILIFVVASGSPLLPLFNWPQLDHSNMYVKLIHTSVSKTHDNHKYNH
jgi:hypothetical protein